MKIFITGADGFIGQHMKARLKDCNSELSEILGNYND